MITYPVQLPSPNPAAVEWHGTGATGFTMSPWTAQQQVADWCGEFWSAKVTLPQMTRAQAEIWIATLLALKGRYGTFCLGDVAGAAPRGSGGASSVQVAGLVSGSRVIFTNGWPYSTSGVLKAGDYIQIGAGINATQIVSTGGSLPTFLIYDAGISTHAQSYITSCWIANIGTKNVKLSDSLGGVVTVAPGQTIFALVQSTGDGSTHIDLGFVTPNAGDGANFIAWNPSINRLGIDENLIPSGNQQFVGFQAYGGATVTLTQGINQRLYKCLADVNSDANGCAEIQVFPRVRDTTSFWLPITLNNTQGIFRLTKNDNPWLIDTAMHYGLAFECMEAL